MKSRPVFYVEDDENDVFLMQHAFKQCGIPNPLLIATDGQEAIDRLAQWEQSGGATKHDLPCLIFLDLNMPRKSGHDVLRWIRNSQIIRNTVVIMLTSYSHDQDVQKAYSLGANAYVVKPSMLTALIETVTTIREFWLKQNITPAALPALETAKLTPTRAMGVRCDGDLQTANTVRI